MLVAIIPLRFWYTAELLLFGGFCTCVTLAVASEERLVTEKPEDRVYPFREYSVCMARGRRPCSDRKVGRGVMFQGKT